jgi:hypothetical protein
MRRLKNFSRKRPVTAHSSLVLTAANTVSRRITETRARERARNSYIRDHEQRHAHSRIRIDHDGHRAREQASSAVGATAWRARPMTGSRRGPPRLRRRRNRWRVRRRICLVACLTGRAQDSSMSRPLSASSGSGRQHGQEPDRARSGPALRGKRRSHPNCAGCTTSRPAGSRPCHLNHPIAACRWRRGQLLGTTGQQRTGRSAPRSAALAQCRFS